MSQRVVVWGTGNVGRHALAGVEARPDLELVGVWVSSEAKAGRDAGDLAGLAQGRALLWSPGGYREVRSALADAMLLTPPSTLRPPIRGWGEGG